MNEEVIELAWTNRWYATRFGRDDYAAHAQRTADELVAAVTGQTSEPKPKPEPVPKPRPELPPVVPDQSFEPPEWLQTRRGFPIVGHRFTPSEFLSYCRWVRDNESFEAGWEPIGVTMHHTAYPHLSMRPNGFEEKHMTYLGDYYEDDLGWSSGPHIFTDDHGIWVHTPLSNRGIHAVSFNNTRFGVEMLGDFDYEDDPEDPRAEKSIGNGKAAAAILMKAFGLGTSKLNFHRMDNETSKTCPGTKVKFAPFERDVIDIYGGLE